jgi:hypothetical protein
MQRDLRQGEGERLTFLGRVDWRSDARPFGILETDRFAHTFVVGKTGTGKSSLLEAMIRQDILKGYGLALLDPHGDLAERLVAWMPAAERARLIYLDVPDPTQRFGFNPLSGVPPLRRSLAANGLVEALKKLFLESWGPRLEYILRSAFLLLLDQPAATIADVLRLFSEAEFRAEAVQRATNAQVRRFWTEEFEKYPGRFRVEAISPIENKLGSFLVDPFVSRILTVPESTFDPRTVMDEGQVLIVNLAKGKIGEAPAMLFGSLLVAAIGLAGLSRADGGRRPPFFVYLDEFQTFTTLALANMLSELRKYRQGIVLSTQFMEQAPPEVRAAILGNVGSLLVFRVGAADAAKLAKELGPTVDPVDLTFIANRAFWARLLVRGEAVPPFTGRTIPISPTKTALPAP